MDKNLPTHSEDIEKSSSHADGVELSEDAHHKNPLEKKLVRKLDAVILPLLFLSFFIAYLDRNNIGNARVMGLQANLKLSDEQFFNCLMMFFVGYMVFQLPANICMRVVGPSRQLGVAVIAFGICGICLSTVTTYAQILGLRLLIGTGEAFVQVGLLYFSFWYRRNEVATRAAIYYTSATLSGMFSGLIAYGVDKNLRVAHGRHSWQWLFIVEGCPALAIGLLLLFFLPDFPEDVQKKGSLFFNKEERDLAVQRTLASNNELSPKIRWNQVLVAFKDPKALFGAVIYGALCLGIASVTSFLPTFISDFGFSRLQTQLYTMIPYSFATVTLLSACIVSDRINSKGPVLLLCLATTTVGYIILMSTTNTVALVAGTCFVTSGLYPAIMLAVAWITTNQGGYTKRSTAWAMAQITGQGLSIIGTQVYRKPPRFLSGHGTLLAFFVAAMVATVSNYFYMKRQNEKKDAVARGFAERGVPNPESEKTYEELYDYHPDFKYVL